MEEGLPFCIIGSCIRNTRSARRMSRHSLVSVRIFGGRICIDESY